MSQSTANGKPKLVTFVVHGVGAPKPSSVHVDPATSSFAAAWGARHGVAIPRRNRIVSSGDDPRNKSERHEAFTEYSIYRGRLPDGREHDIVELQWADLSRTSAGPWGAIQAFMRVLFGLKYLGRSVLHPLEQGSAEAGDRAVMRFFGLLSRIIIGIVEGPILAVNVILAVGLGLYVFWPAPISPGMAVLLMGLGGALLTYLLALGRNEFARWGVILGLIVAAFCLWQQDSFYAYLELIAKATGFLWALATILAGSLVLGWGLSRRFLSDQDQRCLDLHVFVTALLVRVWTWGILIIWQIGLVAIPENPASALISSDDLTALKEAFAPTIGVNWTFAIVILAATILSFYQFRRRTKNGCAGQPGESNLVRNKREARVLVAPLILWVVNLLMLIAAIGVLVLFFDAIPEWLAKWLLLLNQLGWVFTGLLAVAVVYLHKKIRTGLDFALDVTNYFDPHARPILQLIAARFRAVVEDVSSNSQPELVFLTHSQGTVLIRDFLARQRLQNAMWVTMGSPLGHLYGYYFGSEFWAGSELKKELNYRLWLNLYRDGDYVGREIALGDENLPEPDNEEPIGPGGHTNYFGDEQVQKCLEKHGVLPKP